MEIIKSIVVMVNDVPELIVSDPNYNREKFRKSVRKVAAAHGPNSEIKMLSGNRAEIRSDNGTVLVWTIEVPHQVPPNERNILEDLFGL